MTSNPSVLQLGFIPLVDCAPLVVARELGLDRRHGLAFELRRQASWAAVRDRLISGELDAAHALAGMVHGLQAGIGGPQVDMAVLLTLNQNGQAITLSTRLADALAQMRTLGKALATLPRPAVFAQTFPTGTHAMWLYYWLAAQGVDPMRDVRIVTLPPPQMPWAMESGEIDGYCAGEPWSAQAEARGLGRRVIRSGEIWPGHPEKVLACRRDFIDADPGRAVALTATVLEACRWLDDADNRREAVEWLARPDVIDQPAAQVEACLLPDEPAVAERTRLRFHGGGEVNMPWLSDGYWFRRQFRRWGLLDGAEAMDREAVAAVQQVAIYRDAARLSGVAVSPHDIRGSVLFDGGRA